MSSQSSELLVDGDAAALAAEGPPRDDAAPGMLTLLGRALLFSNAPFVVVRDGARPGRRGLRIILVILGLVVLAQLLGYWFGSLTAPRLDSLQALLRNAIVGLPWYAQQTQADPTFAGQFQQGYLATWEAIRILLRYPTVTATGGTVAVVTLATIVNWLVFAVLAHWVARWYGSSARFGQTLGVLALAYAPLLLRVIEIVPGAVAPTTLIFLLMLASKYLALKTVHGLGSAETLFVLLAPYGIVAVLAVLLLLNGGAYGLQQIPAVDQALQLQQFLGR